MNTPFCPIFGDNPRPPNEIQSSHLAKIGLCETVMLRMFANLVNFTCHKCHMFLIYFASGAIRENRTNKLLLLNPNVVKERSR